MFFFLFFFFGTKTPKASGLKLIKPTGGSHRVQQSNNKQGHQNGNMRTSEQTRVYVLVVIMNFNRTKFRVLCSLYLHNPANMRRHM